MAIAEAPVGLQGLLIEQACAGGVNIIRNIRGDIRCMNDGHVRATFLVWWPNGHATMHVLMPRGYVKGRA